MQLKAALRGHDYETQVQMLSPDGPLAGATDVHSAAEKGISGSSGALPHAAKIQQSFGGYDLSNIQAHTGPEAQQGAAAMGADAYATGNHVVFNKGGADLHTAAHEAAHVVQQSGGVALSGGVGKSGDVYEKHADKVADAVVAGESAEGLLGGDPSLVQSSTANIQLKLDPTRVAAGASGVDMCVDESTQESTMRPELSKDGESRKIGAERAGKGDSEVILAPGLGLTTGTVVSFDIGLNIPLLGVIKLEAKAAGSYVQKNNGGNRSVEVEGAIYAGVLIDLVIFKIRFGVEGKVKFVVQGDEDLMGAVKRGIKEILQWRIASEMAEKVAAVKTAINSFYYPGRVADFNASLDKLRDDIREQGTAVSSLKWLIAKSPRDWAEARLEDWNNGIIEALDYLDADVEVVRDKLVNLNPVTAALDGIQKANTHADAMACIAKARNLGNGALFDSKRRVLESLTKLEVVKNDPAVGFTASLAFKAGASAQLGKRASAELEFAAVESYEDKVGQTD